MKLLIAKSIGYMLLIVLGYALKCMGVFKIEDKNVLGKVMMYITLPCAFVANFQDFEAGISLIFYIMIGFLANVLMIMTGYLVSHKRENKTKALFIIDCSGYNIGAFTTPVVSSYLPAEAVVISSMFDIGNCMMSVGSVYPLAKRQIDKSNTGINPIKYFLTKLFQSVPFDTYLIMLILSLLGIRMPQLVNEVTGLIGGSSIILTMIMIGIAFEVKISKEDMKDVITILVIRYILAVIFSYGIWQISAFSMLAKKVLIICFFAPTTSISPTYCNLCKCKPSVYGAVSSFTVPISLLVFIFLMQIL